MTFVGRSMVSRWSVPPAAHPNDVVKGGFEQGETKRTKGDKDLGGRDPKGCAGIRDPETECRSIPGQTPSRVHVTKNVGKTIKPIEIKGAPSALPSCKGCLAREIPDVQQNRRFASTPSMRISNRIFPRGFESDEHVGIS